jgi:hypothetical protein
MGLRGAQDRPGRTLDERAGEPDRRVGDVDLAPAQSEELAAPGAGRCGQPQVGGEVGIAVLDVGEEPVDLVGRGRAHLGRGDPRWGRGVGGVEPHPLPAHRLGECPVQHDMNPVHGARGQRSAIAAAATQEVLIEVVDVKRGQLVDGEVTQVGLEVMLDDAARLPHRGG